jgi:putative endonuclease
VRAKDAVGRYGENVAARHLEDAGLRVLDRNWRSPSGELDIVALDGTELVVVEVKTRRSDACGHPAEAVTELKLRRIRRLAAEWLVAHDVHPSGIRIDVVAVQVAERGAARVERLTAVLE